MIVELSPEQMFECVEEAVRRSEYYLDTRHRKNMKNNLTEEEIIGFNLDGCMGEYACAIALNYDWTGCEGFTGLEYDVGDYIEVRSSRRLYGSLIVKASELDKRKPSTPYVLALIDGTSVRLLGWRHLEDIVDIGEPYDQKGQRFIRVRQRDLYDMSALLLIPNDWDDHEGP